MSAGNQKPEQFIDLQRYPVNDLDSAAGQQLIADCHRMMDENSICTLPGFLQQNALDALVSEMSSLQAVARQVDFLATPYGWMQNDNFPENHPRAQLFNRRCSTITTEQIDSNGPSIALFKLDALTEFVRRLLGYETLYRSACPNISVRVNMMQQGDEFGWHYDTNDGVVSFCIQNADVGGIFEYAPLIRSEENENYGAVKKIMCGKTHPEQADTPPGTFVLFMGRRSLHRVSPVGKSTRFRHSLLFSYDRKPDMVFPENIRKRLTEPSNTPFLGSPGTPEPEIR